MATEDRAPPSAQSSAKRKTTSSPTPPPLPQAKRWAVPDSTAFEVGSEREIWLVNRMQDADVYLPMQAVREERLRHKLPSKAKVYEELAKEFNDRRFASVSGGFYTTAITGGGIKTKITRILDGFKRALVVKRKADDGEGPNNLKAVLTKHCKYFFQLEKFWGDDCNALAPLFIDPTTDDRLGPLPAKDFVTDAPRVVEVGCDSDDGDSGIKEELSSNAAEDPIGWSDLEKDDDEPLQRSRRAASTPRATPVREHSQQGQYRLHV
ncbi:hypothetical protein DFQ26_000449 [Actinomortierella ambigua]|nr:hypothetical protein DFQ26_000449 [Actinomortierella ambigua]